ncbi:MAG TPA: AAA family ATPase [Ktedonobacteraceae bacterium]|nr:AAA family ATPase [Ktedonobacteraceae bacterium]
MSGDPASPLHISLPSRTLIVLCGPAGSGKSTFAHRLIQEHRNQGLVPTMIVSSDHCRTLVSDDENNQQVNRDAFDLFHYIIHKRMFHNRLTIADSTALQPIARRRLLTLAQQHHYATCLLVFHISPQTCLQRDSERARMVGEQVIAYHMTLLQQALRDIPEEHWDQVHILGEQDMDVTLEIIAS